AVLYTFGVISLIGNCLLIVFVLNKNLLMLGSYRCLLIIFASFDMIVSVFHARVLPHFFQIKDGFLMFPYDILQLPPTAYTVANIITCFLFYEAFPLLTCHFIYRYLVIAR
ncbi:hypothetical protein PMAYCL1PPCAC_33085, partial [Pristionchus mayeri]